MKYLYEDKLEKIRETVDAVEIDDAVDKMITKLQAHYGGDAMWSPELAEAIEDFIRPMTDSEMMIEIGAPILPGMENVY